MSFFSKWSYIRIELEILGVVMDTRYVLGRDYDRVLRIMKNVGKCQPYEWAIFVKRHIGKQSLAQRERRRKLNNESKRRGRELKKKAKTLLCDNENERPR